ncbi:MAG TPA: Na+/H+ antiporter subunit E [Actinomycetota bacterium]|nr:Na+/H+ antiporter subunit E [Actinomycetota bacterium]
MRVLRRTWCAVTFVAYYLRELVVSVLYVSYEVVTPSHRQRPGIVRFPIRAATDLEITLLANAISFTPGTLTLEVAEDRTALFVHILITETPDHARERLGLLEKRLLAVLR